MVATATAWQSSAARVLTAEAAALACGRDRDHCEYGDGGITVVGGVGLHG
jgi:hypothetical protein